MGESRLLNPDELKRIAAEMAAYAKAEKAEVSPASPLRRGKIIGLSTRTRPNQVLIAPIEEGGFVPPPPPPEDEEKALYTLITDELLPPEASQAAATPPSPEVQPSAGEQKDQKTADELLQSLKEADPAEYGGLLHARVTDEEIKDGYRIDRIDKTLVINRELLRNNI